MYSLYEAWGARFNMVIDEATQHTKQIKILTGTPVKIPVSFGFLVNTDGRARRKTTGVIDAIFISYENESGERARVEFLGETYLVSSSQILA